MKTSKPEIKIVQTGLGKILKDFTLAVPSHQRDYAWTEKEVTKLFQDLSKAIGDNETEYFLGTITTIPDASGLLEVIDGQQRLATATILLSRIRNYLANKDDFIAKSIDVFLTYPDRAQREDLPKLKLNLTDNDFFKTIISPNREFSITENDSMPRSHKLLCNAYKKATEHVNNIVAGFDINAHGDVLNKWISFIEDGAEVILLQIPTGKNAFRMFETLNDRGLRATQADLVKNHLFREAGNRLKEAECSWMGMRRILESLQEEEDITVTFLRHALMVMQGALTQDEVYEAVQKRTRGPQSVMTFLKEIESLSAVYVATFYSDHEKWMTYPDTMRPAIKTVNFFNIHPFRPALLAIASKFSPKEAALAFQIFISLGVRLLIASSTRSGSIEETLASAANKVFLEKIKTAKDFKAAISSIIPSDEQFKQAFEIATVSKSGLARYYLRTLERVAKNEPNPWFTLNEDKEIINLEHVLPSNPDNNWPEFTDEQAETFYKRLGNMALLKKITNTENKNGSFSQKRPSFKDSPYELTAQIHTSSNWTPQVIHNRQCMMAGLATKAWPI